MEQDNYPIQDSNGKRLPDEPSETVFLGRTKSQLIVQGAAALILLIFVLQNLDEVEVDFLFWTVDSRLAWALLLSAALGFLVGIFRLKIHFRRRR